MLGGEIGVLLDDDDEEGRRREGGLDLISSARVPRRST